MSVVGVFPGHDAKRRTIRAPVNPMDISTVVSIYPKVINEVKHTIQPGRFSIAAGSYDIPALLIVGPSSWWREIDEEQPLLEIPNSSIQIADSIVKDYCNGLLGCNMSDAMPGLFYIPGRFNVAEIKKTYNHLLIEAKNKQDNWYKELINKADSDWARSNGNPLTISEDMRLAAREMKLAKDWMKDFTQLQLVACPACSTRITSNIIICPNCKVILDKVRFKELGMEFAK